MILSEDHFNGFGAIFKCFSTAGQTAKTHVLEIQALAALSHGRKKKTIHRTDFNFWLVSKKVLITSDETLGRLYSLRTSAKWSLLKNSNGFLLSFCFISLQEYECTSCQLVYAGLFDEETNNFPEVHYTNSMPLIHKQISCERFISSF